MPNSNSAYPSPAMSDTGESDINALQRLHIGDDLDQDDFIRLLDTDSDKEVVVGSIIYLICPVIMAFATPLYQKERYHTSALSGTAWVEELMDGHPE